MELKENLNYIEWVASKKLRIISWSSYIDLFCILDSMEYRYTDSMDQPRLQDGLYLRKIYYGETGRFDELGDRSCSVFEMLAMFAYRIDGECFGDPANPEPDLVFMKMIENVAGNNKLTNYWLINNRVKDNLIESFEEWMSGLYQPNGVGGPFPIPDTERDLRKVNLWSQMNEYYSKKRR